MFKLLSDAIVSEIIH